MQMKLIALAAAFMAAASAATGDFQGDSRRGAAFFRDQGCAYCHPVRGQGGQGGRLAPDLGGRGARSYTPATMAAQFWNHAPEMWSAMEAQRISRPQVSRRQAGDLFAYFYSVRFFDAPGDAARGKRVFESKGCVTCHGIKSAVAPAAKPVVGWKSLEDPLALVQEMWNHSGQMRASFKERKLSWPHFTSQDVTDLFVYLQNLPETRSMIAEFAIPDPSAGEALFRERGSLVCHQGRLDLQHRALERNTLMDVAAAMWNHAPSMIQPPPRLEPREMRSIVSYIWNSRFFAATGSAARGRNVFSQKGCAGCHNEASGEAGKLKGTYDPLDVVSALWKHGPTMLERMKAKNVAWPRFRGEEMSDLVSYLSSDH